MANRFCRYHLRTTNADAARAFYSDVVGASLWGADVIVTTLPERALAAGAPAHWLGHIGVRDVEATVQRFVAKGARQLGPTQDAEGVTFAALLDPFGARFGVSAEIAAPRRAPIVWHQLASLEVEKSWALYEEAFGWTATGTQDLGAYGKQHTFAWDDARTDVGAAWSIVGRPEVHPQWLFFFEVEDVERAIARVRALGGLALAPTRTPSNAIAVACDDAQGAAFGLMQRA